jgi:hypothetical protein
MALRAVGSGTNAIQKTKNFASPRTCQTDNFSRINKKQISPTKKSTAVVSKQKQQQCVPLTERRRLFYANWQTITLDPRILAIVQGYKIEI